MLKTLNEKEKANWKDCITQLAFAYNSTVNKTTGYSPFYLLFGRTSRLPIDNIFGIQFETSISKSYDEFVSQWQERMKTAIEIAQKNEDKTGAANQKIYNKKVRGEEIVAGDQVLLRNFQKGGTGKLRSYWQDTIYTVKEKHPDVPVYTIHPMGERKKTKKVHRNLISKCNDLQLEKKIEKNRARKPTKASKRTTTTTESSSEDDVIVRWKRQDISKGERGSVGVEETECIDVESEEDVGSNDVIRNSDVSSDEKTFLGFESEPTTEDESTKEESSDEQEI